MIDSAHEQRYAGDRRQSMVIVLGTSFAVSASSVCELTMNSSLVVRDDALQEINISCARDVCDLYFVQILSQTSRQRLRKPFWKTVV